jgi:hypothetical protein
MSIVKRLKFELGRSRNEQAAVLRIEGRKLWHRLLSGVPFTGFIVRRHIRRLERRR